LAAPRLFQFGESLTLQSEQKKKKFCAFSAAMREAAAAHQQPKKATKFSGRGENSPLARIFFFVFLGDSVRNL
jgi:hypothetical protein